MQGATNGTVKQLEQADITASGIDPAERELLVLVEKLTRGAHRTTADDMDRVRAAGWSDPQIAEAVYITGIFAMFNRVADAFGLADPGYGGIDSPPRPAESGG